MPKRIHRIIPCAPTDIAGVQHFLEEMARKGRILKQEPLFNRYAAFEVTDPQSIRYRLTPSDDGKDPGSDELLFAKELGWEYRLLWNNFHIYASTDPNAPELNTDPQVMALAMKPAIRRTVTQITGTLLILLVLPFWQQFFTVLLSPKGWTILMILAMSLLGILGGLRNLIHLLKMRKSLLEGLPIDPSPAYRRSLPRFWTGFILGRIFGYVYILTFIAVAFSTLFAPPASMLPHADLSRLPYASMMEILPDDLTDASIQQESSTLDSWSTFLSPVNHESYEGYSLHLEDSRLVTCSLTVRYHETCSEDYAKLVAEEMIRDLQRDSKEGDFEETLSIDGIDTAYLAGRRSACLVIRDGNTVLHVTCMVHNVDEELETCLTALRGFAALYTQEVTP